MVSAVEKKETAYITLGNLIDYKK